MNNLEKYVEVKRQLKTAKSHYKIKDLQKALKRLKREILKEFYG